MIRWRRGRVVSLGRAWPGAQELTVTLEDGAVTHEVPALSYPTLTGELVTGDVVLLNVSAHERGLGTGGGALVVARVDPPPDTPDGPGHLVKARYTPTQAMVLGVDEQESAHHALLADADDLAGLPVVVADLHSALPAVVAGARWSATHSGRPLPRIVYVMTDGGALPAGFSRTIAQLRGAGWLAATITSGQAFGGDLEAVTVHTALLAAHLVTHADLVVVTQGPGNLGTGTRWGFSGVGLGETVNAAGTLGGQPVAALRVSGADPRERHRGISHHSLTAYGRVALLPADIVVPSLEADLVPLLAPGTAALAGRVQDEAAALREVRARHRLVEIAAAATLLDALRQTPAPLRSMGRGLNDDPLSFIAAAVAGIHAERLACAQPRATDTPRDTGSMSGTGTAE